MTEVPNPTFITTLAVNQGYPTFITADYGIRLSSNVSSWDIRVRNIRAN